MTVDEIQLIKELDYLRLEHRRLDEEIGALARAAHVDSEFQVVRLKKQKLGIKDRIYTLESTLYPDIIA